MMPHLFCTKEVTLVPRYKPGQPIYLAGMSYVAAGVVSGVSAGVKSDVAAGSGQICVIV